jgi:hypothetical protein
MYNVVSVDGFIADDNDDVGPPHDWYFSGDTPLTDDVSAADQVSGRRAVGFGSRRRRR